MAAEFWVMKIIVAKGAPVNERIARLVDSGDLHAIGGDICEPVEQAPSQETAMVRAGIHAARTGIEHKVVINAELDDLTGEIG